MAVGDLDALISSLEGLPVAAMLTELRTHTFIAVNAGAAALFGSPAREATSGQGARDRASPALSGSWPRLPH